MDPNLPKGSSFKKQLSFKTITFIVFGVFLSVGATLYILFFTGKIKQPNLSSVFNKQPTVSLKTESQNPFKKETDYVNPFNQYKSPFYNLKDKTAK